VNGADVHGWLLQHRPELAARIVFITGDIANEKQLTRCKNAARLVWKNRSAYSSLFQWLEKIMGKHCER